MFWTYPAGKGTRPLKTTSSRSENPRRAVFVLKAGWRGATKETAMRVSAQLILGKPTRKAWGAHTLHRSSTEEQRSQTAFRTKILWTAGLLSVGGVGSAFTARSGMLRPRRLAHSQNPPPPHPSQFSDRLLIGNRFAHRRKKIFAGFLRDGRLGFGIRMLHEVSGQFF